jgi:hypothetical protein
MCVLEAGRVHGDQVRVCVSGLEVYGRSGTCSMWGNPHGQRDCKGDGSIIDLFSEESMRSQTYHITTVK